MGKLVAALEETERTINRKILASWAEQTMLELAEAGADIYLYAELAEAGTCRDSIPRHGPSELPWLEQHITPALLARVGTQGTGDPNPVYVKGKPTEEAVLKLLQHLCYEVAMVFLSKIYALQPLKDANFTSDEAKGLQLDKMFNRKAKQLARFHGSLWSWKAMDVYKGGKEDEEDDEDDEEQEEEEDDEGDDDGEDEDKAGDTSPARSLKR